MTAEWVYRDFLKSKTHSFYVQMKKKKKGKDFEHIHIPYSSIITKDTH